MTWPRSVASLLALLLLAGLALGLGTERRAAHREAETMAAHPPIGAFVEVDGKRVHYVQRGTGPDLVLIHGASGNLMDMTFSFMDRLTDRYRVTAFDRPGLGYTDRARSGLDSPWAARAETPAEQAALLRAAAKAIGIRDPIVLGHSFGNSVALAWALDDPEGVAALVDVSGVAMPWPGRLGWLYRATSTRLGGAVVPALVTAFATEGAVKAALASTFRPNAMPAGYAEGFGVALSLRRASFRANARQVNDLRPQLVAMSARYGTLTMPVEVLFGDQDTIVPPSVHAGPFVALVPGAHLTILPGIGHMPHHASPEAVIAGIDRARARAEAAGRLPAP